MTFVSGRTSITLTNGAITDWEPDFLGGFPGGGVCDFSFGPQTCDFRSSGPNHISFHFPDVVEQVCSCVQPQTAFNRTGFGTPVAASSGPIPRDRLWVAGSDLGERRPSWLVATAAEDRLSFRRNLYTSFAAASDCRTIAIYVHALLR
jgi:hypothetical protein